MPVPGAQGISTYKRGDFQEAIAVSSKTLREELGDSTQISLLSIRAHTDEKVPKLKFTS